MFDGCRKWRSLLTRRAEGALSPGERALLDDHLTRCAACSIYQDADATLREVCSEADLGAPAPPARAFDDRVVSALRAMPADASSGMDWRERARAYRAGLSFDFCMQLAGGALAAAAVTAFLLVSALNSAPASTSLSPDELRAMSSVQHSAPPVPLESLFQSPTPRAAMLWATPGRSLRRRAPEKSASPQQEAPPDSRPGLPRRHGYRARAVSVI